MDEQEYTQLYQQTFIPDMQVRRFTVRRSLGKLRVATAEMPTQPCRMALRVGYTGSKADDLAIYRLKIHLEKGRYMTLPALFVVEQGQFLLYEKWLKIEKQNNQEQRTEQESIANRS